ncbi:hypothetical protein [Actinomadura sp. J1-007]|uniref:hypothetical protein n=1 Tax=Actinomadura sp. J1-007 TaxID=2661913 RepID=UPI001F4FB599|nr:hypothetical protein [Actinomadura sp. J1-007]
MRLTGQGLKGLTFPLVSSVAFIVVTVLATGLLAASITDTTSGDRVSYYAKFTDVAGCTRGTACGSRASRSARSRRSRWWTGGSRG